LALTEEADAAACSSTICFASARPSDLERAGEDDGLAREDAAPAPICG
jgi:hypothetical protein